MHRLKTTMLAVASACLLTGLGQASWALESGGHDTPPHSALRASEPGMDPMLQALLIGVAASLLREAALSPDPMSALGETFERKLGAVLRSPETLRLIEALLGQAFKDVPLELREPLTMFAHSMLGSMRRDMLEGGRLR